MELACCRAIPPQFVFASFAADKKQTFRKKSLQGFDFVIDVRRHLVGYRQHQVLLSFLNLLLAANLQNRYAGAAADRMRIREIFRTVEQRNKRNVMENMVGNDDQIRRLDLALNGFDQLTVQFTEMMLSRLQQHRRMHLNVPGLKMEFRQLKSKAF